MATLNAIYKISADITNLKASVERGVAATESLDRSFTSATSSALSMMRSVTSLAGVSAMGALVGQVMDLAGELTDLSARTGLSTTELQKLRGVGNQVGVTIDQIAGSVNQLQNRLAGGDNSAIAALRQLGLTWEQLKEQTPEEQFRTLLERLGEIPDHAQMVATGTDLMGRGFKDLIPLVKAGVDELDRVKTMSPEAVRGLDELGDAWQRFKDNSLASVGELVASLTSFEGAIVQLAQTTAFNAEKMRNDWRLTKAIFEDVNKSLPDLSKVPESFGRSAIAMKDVTMTGAQLADVERQLNQQIQRGTRELKESAEATRRQTEEFERQVAEIERLRATDIITFYNEFAAALKNVRNVAEGVPDALENVGKVAVDFEQARQSAIGISDAMLAWMTGNGIFIGSLDMVDDKTVEWKDGLDDLSRSLGILAQVSGDTFGGIVQELATLVAAMNTATKAGEQMAKGGFMNILNGGLAAAGAIGQATATGSRASRIGKGALTGMQAGAAFGPIGMGIGAGVGALVGAFRGRGAGRQMVEDFAESVGGFDQLRLRLRALGDEGERLWQQMGKVGKGNTKQAEEAIAALSKGLQMVPTELNKTLSAALTTGAGIDSALTPLLEDLIRTNQITEENANLLMGLPAKGVPAFNEVAAAADALGLDMDALGQNIKQLRFTETAEGIAHHLDVLQRAGADMNAVFLGSRDKIQKLVDDASKGFLSLPESMRPFLQQMVDAGMLTDIFGNTLTDLEDLHFTKPLEKSVEDLVEALHELVGVIKNDVGGALDELGRKVVKPRVEVDSGSIVGQGGPTGERPEHAEATINITTQVAGQTIAEATANATLGWG